jgi:hypothetical protein
MSSADDLSVASDVPDDDHRSNLEDAASQNGEIVSDVDDLFDDDAGNEKSPYDSSWFSLLLLLTNLLVESVILMMKS